MKGQIKVIKRSEIAERPVVVKKGKNKPVTAKSAAREMVSTVSSWVSEFQQRRAEETKEAFKLLFQENTQPNGCANC